MRAARAVASRIALGRVLMQSWRRAPASARAAIPLLVLLNLLVAVVLLSAPEEFSRLWATPTIAAYLLMLCVNAALLNSILLPSIGAAPEPAENGLAAMDLGPAHAADAEGAGDDAADLNDTIVGTRTIARRSERAQAPADDEPPTTPTPARGDDRFRRRLAVVASMVAAGWIALAHPGLPLTLAVLVLGLALVFTVDIDREQTVTMVLALAVGVAAIDYVSWRVEVTNWAGWWIAVPLLCAEALGALHVLGYQFTIWPRRVPQLDETVDPSRYPIFVFIPTVNEGVDIVRRTLEGCIAARTRYLAHHPDATVTIVVCNDGRAANTPNWAEMDELASELGVRCVTRTVGGGAKAGNIENARQQVQATGDALVVIFDADQIAEPDFFLRTIAPFADATVGWVQTGQYYANLKNPVARWADDQQSLFYNVLCPGKAALNAAFICGTNVVIRAAALDEIGGLPQDSVTEDFAASIVLHRKWRSVYLSEVLATGLGPLDIPSYLKQQGRWARGTLGVLGSNWRDIFLPRRNGLRAGQRAQYALACTHYLCGVRDLIYMLSPILFIVTAIPAVRRASLGDYLWHFLPYAVLGLSAMWYSARRVSGLRGIIIGFGSFPALLQSLSAVLLRRKTGFSVTSKRASQGRSFGYLGIYVFMVLLCLAAVVWALLANGTQRTSLFISLLWIVYSLLLLGGFLGLAWADRRAQAAQHSGEMAVAATKQRYPSKLLERPSPLRPLGTLGLAMLMASPLLVSPPLNSSSVFAPHADAFVLTENLPAAPYVGVSVPIELLETRPQMLEDDLGIRFAMVGRTQNISDRFDEQWADELAVKNANPWITLEFGELRNGKAPLSANLPAIYNGLRDGDIKRWARQIRNYQRPVYVTILPHADKDWSASSGVAHGGIPADVPKAWLHVQSVFRAVGATNVAWIWAPADPLHDREYAPPGSSIDAVLQSFINYPGTQWGDPNRVLDDLTRRYPRKPLFVEASAAGPAPEKAEWLRRLGQAVEETPSVYAVLYHEGGPSLKPTKEQARHWSLASDAQSLATTKRIFSVLDRERRLG